MALEYIGGESADSEQELWSHLNFKLNDFVSVWIDSPTTVSLDIKEAPEGASFPKLLNLFLDGLQKLHARLEKDPQFESITVITATTWIGREIPEVLEGFGFTIDYEETHPLAAARIAEYKRERDSGEVYYRPEHRSIEPVFAWISTDKFMKLPRLNHHRKAKESY